MFPLEYNSLLYMVRRGNTVAYLCVLLHSWLCLSSSKSKETAVSVWIFRTKTSERWCFDCKSQIKKCANGTTFGPSETFAVLLLYVYIWNE